MKVPNELRNWSLPPETTKLHWLDGHMDGQKGGSKEERKERKVSSTYAVTQNEPSRRHSRCTLCLILQM